MENHINRVQSFTKFKVKPMISIYQRIVTIYDPNIHKCFIDQFNRKEDSFSVIILKSFKLKHPPNILTPTIIYTPPKLVTTFKRNYHHFHINNQENKEKKEPKEPKKGKEPTQTVIHQQHQLYTSLATINKFQLQHHQLIKIYNNTVTIQV
ncbi:hypothetical protein ACTFIU_010170 [Dictyostelium citrinum]